jgi:predicted nucleic acid-binding protein
MTHLLDSSAWLAHLFGEPGVDEINLLFNDPNIQVSISALSIPEVFTRLEAIGRGGHWDEVWTIYSELFFGVFEADEAIALQAVKLRAETSKRLPMIDDLIAATALTRHLTLVHRDPHLATIADPGLLQMKLPDK